MKFRVRSIDNIVAEMKELYDKYGVRIFNFQDDNFFLPEKTKALHRFEELRDKLKQAGVVDIAIAIKARPDSITRESISVLDELGLFRVFLGVENACENGLRNLNRKQTIEQSLNALQILNDYDVHLAFNLLMFEPDTVMDDLLVNLRFMERHLDNPFNFCRAEAHAGTGLEEKLKGEGKLLGDYFGLDYRLKDPKSEAFHQVVNYAFFDRNFSDYRPALLQYAGGLHLSASQAILSRGADRDSAGRCEELHQRDQSGHLQVPLPDLRLHQIDGPRQPSGTAGLCRRDEGDRRRRKPGASSPGRTNPGGSE